MTDFDLQPRITRPRTPSPMLLALVVPVALLIALSPRDALAGCVAASVFCVGVPIGAMLLVHLHTLTGGEWGNSLVPPAARISHAMPIALLAALPVIFGLWRLYPWATSSVPGIELPAFRNWYFSTPSFIARQVALVAIWLTLAWTIRREIRAAAAPVILLIVITSTVLAVDWIGSLDAHFRSSILGLYVCSNFALSGLSLSVLLVPLDVDPRLLRDHGNLLLTFVFVHAYLAFSQFLIIWSGNLPSDIGWYLPRMHGLWGTVAGMMILFQFAVPMALLLFRDIKQRRARLRQIAACLLIMNWCEAAWFVLPTLAESSTPFRSTVVGVATMVLTTLLLAGVMEMLCRPSSMPTVARGGAE